METGALTSDIAGSSSVTSVQQDLIAQLAGDASSTDAPRIRSSPEERAEAASFLGSALADLGLSPMRHAYRLPNVNGLVDLLLKPYEGTNVYAVIPATTPSTQVVVVGAHYDSEPGSPGAGDNASGVALVYALARELSRSETRSVNTLVVFFDQEEDDEVGSRAFVRHLQASDQDVHSVHVTDLSGWDRGGDGVIEIQSPSADLERAYQAAATHLGIEIRVTS